MLENSKATDQVDKIGRVVLVGGFFTPKCDLGTTHTL